jgi:hypothetical protein
MAKGLNGYRDDLVLAKHEARHKIHECPAAKCYVQGSAWQKKHSTKHYIRNITYQNIMYMLSQHVTCLDMLPLALKKVTSQNNSHFFPEQM